MTHAEIRERLQRGRGPISWGELSDLVLADIWYRMLDQRQHHRVATGGPTPGPPTTPKGTT